MNERLLVVALERETDIVIARKRTRKLSELLGFDAQDQTRITTSVSELARNAFEYAGGGRIEFRVSGSEPPQTFEIAVTDKGPGIADPDAILDGSQQIATRLGVSRPMVWRWQQRFAEAGVEGLLHDKTCKPGKPPARIFLSLSIFMRASKPGRIWLSRTRRASAGVAKPGPPVPSTRYCISCLRC